ncbi:MAG TPA: FtsX-like permease family protein, partial [Micromonospora sp.]
LTGTSFVGSGARRYGFTVAAVAATFPTIGRGVDRFVVLPWQALRPVAGDQVAPTGFLLAGAAVDLAEVRRTGDEGQARWYTSGLVTGAAPALPAVATSRSQVRATLGQNGANGVLLFGFGVGTVGGALLGLLAVAFGVLAGARARAEVLSRLRTMGLSRRQSRGLLLFERAPLVTVAVAVGAVVGALLPVVLTSALELSAFTGGLPVRVGFEPGLVGAVLALGLLALVTAVGVETMVNRRQRLGEVLRLGEGG